MLNAMKSTCKILIALSFVVLQSCGSKPEKDILNHWELPESFIKDNKRINPMSLEFKEDGIVNFYSKDDIKFSMPYTLSIDGKTLILTDPSGQEGSMPIKILSLSSRKLVLDMPRMGRFGRTDQSDTLVFEPKK
jgi:hypothetical protein